MRGWDRAQKWVEAHQILDKAEKIKGGGCGQKPATENVRFKCDRAEAKPRRQNGLR